MSLCECQARVAEVQGEQGAFVFSELLMQRLWVRGRFDHELARTLDGRQVRIQRVGTWNRLEGPDFKGARVRIGEEEVEGDVELHLRAADWEAHGHAQDALYNKVVLHVVLFPPKTEWVTRGEGGREIPILPLLGLLPYDLETFAVDDAAERLAGRLYLDAYESLARLEQDRRESLLREHATARWKAKVAHVACRVERLGWEAALHHSALECLGYKFNRAPMLNVATRFPREQWMDDALWVVEAAWRSEEGAWRSHGVRPGNFPKRRLEQYLDWTQARAGWMERLQTERGEMLVRCELLGQGRRGRAFEQLRAAWVERLTGGVLRAARFDTLVVDVLMPFMATLDPEGPERWHEPWFNWQEGDHADQGRQVLKDLGVIGRNLQLACNGYGQGLLGWCLTKEALSLANQ